ncbi:flagellar protein FlgN [Paenibacillus sp. YIM B09110]|uniref:flagellar protein FlgN n=1 Tax=Paenibacillus sp. YIM B09110 TaxID=3126102 RepID=UPI00301D4CA0
MSTGAIVRLLQQQHELYERLLELEQSKKPLIIANDVVQLNVITQKEKLLATTAEELEKKRVFETARYYKDMGFRFRSGVMTELIKSVSNADEKQELMKLQQELGGLLQELKLVNDLNQQLIHQSLTFINFSIDLMQENPNEDVTYQHPMSQQYNNNKRNTWFDSRA